MTNRPPLAADLVEAILAEHPSARIRLASRAPVWAGVPPGLHPEVLAALDDYNIHQLYQHQADSASACLKGQNVMLTTGTSSGKTLAYTLPALQMLAEEPAARILLIFPTKALAQDQLGRLKKLAPKGVKIAVYDGDTPKNQRSLIRREAQVILTNPDMLHVGILPSQELWRKFLRSLRLIVVDEAHTLRGVFGSHCAWVFRRLLRLSRWMGGSPSVFAASATLPNPKEHFTSLFGSDCHLVTDDSSLQSERHWILTEGFPEGPTPNDLSSQLLAELTAEGVRTLAFCRSRSAAETVTRRARKRLERKGLRTDRIDSYRGGYTPEERREIEQAFFNGSLTGLASTNAMELGVDVGGLDAVIINGYPGSLASFRQQAGRCGRGDHPGTVIFVAHPDPLEHYLLEHPELLANPVEPALIDLGNLPISRAQLTCAAYELPPADEELQKLSPMGEATAEDLRLSGELTPARGRWFYPGFEAPASRVSIRGSTGPTIQLVCNGRLIGEMEDWRALEWAFPGAVYIHRQDDYVVQQLDWPNKTAYLTKERVPWTTEPVMQSLAEEKKTVDKRKCGSIEISFSSVEITNRTLGYRRMGPDGTVLSVHELQMPLHQIQTMGAILDPPIELFPIEDEEAGAALHAWQHLLSASAPLLAGCDPRDLGAVWFAWSPQNNGPRVVVYDTVPGGIGLSQRLFKEAEEWLNRSAAMVKSCSCDEGCPRCLLSPRCESNNEPLSKPRLLKVLPALLPPQAPAVSSDAN